MSQTQTDLRIFDAQGNEIPLPDGSSAFPTMTLNPIGESLNFARTTSGKLVNLVDPAFEYYEIGISAAWVDLPAIESMRLGYEFSIWSTIVLKERGSTPSRPAVEGSVVVEDGWVEYRPIFSVKLTDKRQSSTEGKDASWTLTFEEIDGFVGAVESEWAAFTSTTGTVQNWERDGKQFTALDFTTSGSFTVTRRGKAKWIRQGGGARGGNSTGSRAGGGGGAGAHHFEEVFLEEGEYTVQVAASSNSNGNSTVVTGPNGFVWTANGGGQGGENGNPGQDGGSGGGGGGDVIGAGGSVAGSATDSEVGHDGSNGFTSNNSDLRTAGGGGGFSQSGERQLSGGGPGGPGIRYNLWAVLYFAFGGGGGAGRDDDRSRPGIGFGIAGDGGASGQSGTNAQANTGSGGGGAAAGSSGTRSGGLGASGRFIVWAEAD